MDLASKVSENQVSIKRLVSSCVSDVGTTTRYKF